MIFIVRKKKPNLPFWQGAAAPALSPYAARVYAPHFLDILPCFRGPIDYYTHMEDITIACDACGDQFPQYALGSPFGNSLLCESCADAIELEWDIIQQHKHAMDA